MLGDKTVVATVAVKDLAVSKKFYGDTLGLQATEGEDPGGTMYKCGGSTLFVYQSSFAGSNKATSASWAVGDGIESVVKDLKSKGVTFETYDNIPGVSRNGEIHMIKDLKAAWFKDPDGNILNLVNKM